MSHCHTHYHHDCCCRPKKEPCSTVVACYETDGGDNILVEIIRALPGAEPLVYRLGTGVRINPVDPRRLSFDCFDATAPTIEFSPADFTGSGSAEDPVRVNWSGLCAAATEEDDLEDVRIIGCGEDGQVVHVDPGLWPQGTELQEATLDENNILHLLSTGGSDVTVDLSPLSDSAPAPITPISVIAGASGAGVTIQAGAAVGGAFVEVQSGSLFLTELNGVPVFDDNGTLRSSIVINVPAGTTLFTTAVPVQRPDGYEPPLTYALTGSLYVQTDDGPQPVILPAAVGVSSDGSFPEPFSLPEGQPMQVLAYNADGEAEPAAFSYDHWATLPGLDPDTYNALIVTRNSVGDETRGSFPVAAVPSNFTIASFAGLLRGSTLTHHIQSDTPGGMPDYYGIAGAPDPVLNKAAVTVDMLREVLHATVHSTVVASVPSVPDEDTEYSVTVTLRTGDGVVEPANAMPNVRVALVRRTDLGGVQTVVQTSDASGAVTFAGLIGPGDWEAYVFGLRLNAVAVVSMVV